MDKYAFAIAVEDVPADMDGYAESLYGQAKDASLFVSGTTATIEFDRFAASYQAAVDSARRDVEGLGGRIVEITPLPE